MTIQTKTTLKGYFNTGDVPTEAQFADFVSSYPARECVTVGPAGSDADYVCDGTADDVQIQAAIDDVKAIAEVVIREPDGTPYTGIAARGCVSLLRGAYSISTTIDVKGGILLRLTENAALYPVANVNVINLNPRAKISGGIITAQAYDDYASTLIHVDGDESIWGDTYIKDIVLSGGVDRLATAIYVACEAVSTGESDLKSIYALLVDGVSMSNFGYGLKLSQLYSNWIACNSFTNIEINGCQNSIYLVGAQGEGMRGPYNNTFTNIFLELGVSVPTGVGIYCEGWQNHFDPVMIWDVNRDTGTAVNLTSRSLSNRLAGRLEAPIVDNGTTNVIDNYGS